MISNKYHLIPDNNNVVLTLKDMAGNLKTMTVPWIAKSLDECINPPAQADAGDKGIAKDFQAEYHQLHRKKKGKFRFKAPGDLL